MSVRTTSNDSIDDHDYHEGKNCGNVCLIDKLYTLDET